MLRGSCAEVWSRDGDAGAASRLGKVAAAPTHITGMNPRMAALASDPQALARANLSPANTTTIPAATLTASCTGLQTFSQRLGTTAALSAAGGVEAPKPSRGQLYAMYQDLDSKYGEGRITFSMFEDAAATLGMSKQQSDNLFAVQVPPSWIGVAVLWCRLRKLTLAVWLHGVVI